MNLMLIILTDSNSIYQSDLRFLLQLQKQQFC